MPISELPENIAAPKKTNVKQDPITYLLAYGKARIYHAFPLDGTISTKELRLKIQNQQRSLSPVIKMLTEKGLIEVVDRERGRDGDNRLTNIYRRTKAMSRELLELAYPEKNEEEIDFLLDLEKAHGRV